MDFKVGQRVWDIVNKRFLTITEIDLDLLICGKTYILAKNVHQTADSMFEELGYKDKSHTTKGWFLIEKDFGSYIEEIRIDLLTSDYKKSRIFPEDKKMWSGTITIQEHLAIYQKLIELGWIE